MRRLLVRPGGIGDCILCFPALENLRTDYTEVWISRPVVPLVQFADRVRPISSTGLDLVGVGDVPVPDILRTSIASFDQIVSWYGTARPEFRTALQNLNSNCHFHAALPPVGYREHATDFFLKQVGGTLGAVSEPIRVPSPIPRNTIVIHPFSGSPRKNWPLASFHELARKLPLPVEWIAGPEEELAEAVRFENLYELATWMKGARLYIGNDSGITHLAAALGMPVLALFGPSDPAVWAPRNASVMRSESLSSLRPSDVLERTRQLLGLSASSEESASVLP